MLSEARFGGFKSASYGYKQDLGNMYKVLPTGVHAARYMPPYLVISIVYVAERNAKPSSIFFVFVPF